MYFSRMIPNARRVLVLLWGLGVDLCSLDAAFVLATVSNRRKHDCVGTLWPCLRGVVTFGGLKRRAASFRVGGMALCDILTCLSQVVFLTSAMHFARFSEDEFHVSWQAHKFGDLNRLFAWRVHHLRRMVLCVFCESHCQGCVKW